MLVALPITHSRVGFLLGGFLALWSCAGTPFISRGLLVLNCCWCWHILAGGFVCLVLIGYRFLSCCNAVGCLLWILLQFLLGFVFLGFSLLLPLCSSRYCIYYWCFVEISFFTAGLDLLADRNLLRWRMLQAANPLCYGFLVLASIC